MVVNIVERDASPPVPPEVVTGDEAIQVVRRYRAATRKAIRAQVERKRTYVVLINLAAMARAEPDPLVRSWSERAVAEESKAFLGNEDEDHEYPPDSFELAQRRLRSQGHSTCPSCRSVLASDLDFDRWREMRKDHVRELYRRESAVR